MVTDVHYLPKIIQEDIENLSDPISKKLNQLINWEPAHN